MISSQIYDESFEPRKGSGKIYRNFTINFLGRGAPWPGKGGLIADKTWFGKPGPVRVLQTFYYFCYLL
jgi:hypothetical protein